MIRAVNHIAISTHRFEEILHFYRDLIGLREIGVHDMPAFSAKLELVVGLQGCSARHAILSAGNTFLELWSYRAPEGRGAIADRPACDAGIMHLCFDVVNLSAEYERLTAAGVQFHCPPQDLSGVSTTYARDPDGNIVELQEMLSDDGLMCLSQDLLDASAVAWAGSDKI